MCQEAVVKMNRNLDVYFSVTVVCNSASALIYNSVTQKVTSQGTISGYSTITFFYELSVYPNTEYSQLDLSFRRNGKNAIHPVL